MNLLPACFGRWPAACILSLALVPAAKADPVPFPINTTPVLLDGAPLTHLRNTVVHDGSTYHMWLLAGGQLSTVVHATSTDGIQFRTQGTLNPPADYWHIPCGAMAIAGTEPFTSFVRVSQVNGEWLLMAWHHHQPAQTHHSYNTSVWRIGSDPANLNVSQIGPLARTSGNCPTPGAPGGHHIGVFGMVGDRIYLRHSVGAGTLPGAVGGNLGAYRITDQSVSPLLTTPRPSIDPSTPKQTPEAELFAGTGYAENIIPGFPRALVYNAGRTIEQGGVIGTYYSFADHSTLAPLQKELWYVESADGGATWTPPARIYDQTGGVDNGEQVLVNGLPSTRNFSAPEVATDGRAYFLTADACGHRVMVTQASAAADPQLAIFKQFAPASVPVGGVAQLSITLQAPLGCTPAPGTPVVNQLAYTDALPVGTSLTGTVVSNSCGGTLSAPAGGYSVSLQGVALNMGQSCTAVVEVRGDVAGTHTNTIAAAAVSNTEGLVPPQDATASLTVSASPPGPGTVQPVPATGPWSLSALAALLGALAWRQRRR